MNELPDYNTDRNGIILKEYGRNIQKMAMFVCEEQDDEKRKKLAETLIELMKLINPSVKDGQDFNEKVWSHLHIISEFNLTIPNPPFPAPNKELLDRKPDKVEYSDHKISYRHYGKNVEFLIDKAILLEDKEERDGAIIHIGRLMKRFYTTWNKDNVDDEVILQQIEKLSKKQLTFDINLIKADRLFDSKVKDAYPHRDNHGSHEKHGGTGGGKRKFKKNYKRKHHN